MNPIDIIKHRSLSPRELRLLACIDWDPLNIETHDEIMEILYWYREDENLEFFKSPINFVISNVSQDVNFDPGIKASDPNLNHSLNHLIRSPLGEFQEVPDRPNANERWWTDYRFEDTWKDHDVILSSPDNRLIKFYERALENHQEIKRYPLVLTA